MPESSSFDFSRTSGREYKVMLRAVQFRGGEGKRRSAVQRCWGGLSRSAEAVGIPGTGEPVVGSPKKQRLVRFYDTKEHAFYREAGFILRLRRPIRSDGEWSVTLKFRSSDWIRASAQAFKPKSDEKAKFEEDIKANPAGTGFQFIPLFSRSADVETNGVPAKVGDALSLYKELQESLLPDDSANLSLVRNFEAREEVFEGIELTLSNKVQAECAIILWSQEGGDPDETVAAEFSARYELKNDARSPKIAARAWSAFTAICANQEWADPAGPTKTAFVYGKA